MNKGIKHLTGPLLQSALRGWSRRRLPQQKGKRYVRGVEDMVSIVRDRWGIPRIEAKGRADLFFAQGFVHAQDRLWQMEVNRRAAKGELAAVLGFQALDTDRLTRTLGFGRLAEGSWARTGESVRDDVRAYCSGVNAFLGGRNPLPIEFSILRYRPKPWEPSDCAAYGQLMVWTLSHGWVGELTRARLMEKLGVSLTSALAPLYPEGHPNTLPRGIEFNLLKLDGKLQAASGPYINRGMEGGGRGSNGWVISAAKSGTGHAVLCNDVHLPMTAPSLWYFNHLSVDRGAIDITGVSLPGLPYILLGHNQSIAWGATLSYVDCEDLFVEKFEDGGGFRYLVNDRWVEAEVRSERIAVKGQREHIEQVVATRHGPIISDFVNEKGQALALQSTALMPGRTFDGIARLVEAKDWDQFVQAVRLIDSPSLNLLFADIRDNIGYYVSGKVPDRLPGQGLVPSEGWSSENDWRGFIPFEEMPHCLNPQDGYLVTANNRITGDDYPHYLGSLWMNGYRARRIRELLEETPTISIEKCSNIQMDLHSIPGLEMVEALSGVDVSQESAVSALTLLRNWDGRADSSSTGALVYQLLISSLTENILTPLLGERLTKEFLGHGPHPILVPVTEFHGQWIPTLIGLLGKPDSPLWHEVGGYQQTVDRCLAQCVELLTSLLGDDPHGWQWGRLHEISFDHLFAQQPLMAAAFRTGPFSIGGDSNTVMQTAVSPEAPFSPPAIAPSYRQVIDLGHLERSKAMYAPGQSGHLGSSHFSDMVEPWLSGEYFPMTGSVRDEEVESKLILAPIISIE